MHNVSRDDRNRRIYGTDYVANSDLLVNQTIRRNHLLMFVEPLCGLMQICPCWLTSKSVELPPPQHLLDRVVRPYDRPGGHDQVFPASNGYIH
jgi:hypothetical protein